MFKCTLAGVLKTQFCVKLQIWSTCLPFTSIIHNPSVVYPLSCSKRKTNAIFPCTPTAMQSQSMLQVMHYLFAVQMCFCRHLEWSHFASIWLLWCKCHHEWCSHCRLWLWKIRCYQSVSPCCVSTHLHWLDCPNAYFMHRKHTCFNVWLCRYSCSISDD